MTNPSTFFAASDLGAVFPHTHCVRVDELGGAVPGVNFLIKLAKWIRDLEVPIPP